MNSKEIRQSFLDFFASKKHQVVPSGPLVLSNDPTLMFANAGMVQFKDVFTGKDKRSYTRAASSQKCIRISGKHNDLENVGVTARHHTFFEMLGNFSFGDYFKNDAIKFAWQYVHDTLKLDPERIVVTIFEGDKSVAPADEEAAKIWADVTGFDSSRIIRCGLKDNFWAMGDTGPCGPCSEIHYYLGDNKPDPRKFGEEPSADGRGWFELWNLVFMQFERDASGVVKPLPAQSIDTGAGLERFAVVKQGVLSNYDTDLLRPLVDLASQIAGKPYRGSQKDDDMSMRVIADHSRLAAFLISEGVFPDRDGRSYVLRRVMRRAIRHGHRLGIGETFLHHVTAKVVDEMGDVYPQLTQYRELIRDITEQEEKRFRQTLDRGLELITSNKEWRTQGKKRVLPGSVAFKLYDTYGFPLDLQEVIGQESDFAVDLEGFQRELEQARVRSQGSKVNEAEIANVYREVSQQTGTTEFLGYESEEAQSEIVALMYQGTPVKNISMGQEAEIVVRKTPFYAEQGGQVGDKGVIRAGSADFDVVGTQKPLEGLVVHQGKLEKGTLKVGDKVELIVSKSSRSATRRNHSATHLLHWALRKVGGDTIAQKGSLVGPDRLRFDYSTTRTLSDEDLRRVEDLVNEAILQNDEIITQVLPIDEAKKRGAIGIFEEKYGAEVRMLAIGPSLELCGGTHARRTGDIGMFKIISDGAVSAGVRRIEAATGHNALQYANELEKRLGSAAELLKSSGEQVVDRIERLLEQQKELQREIKRLQKTKSSASEVDIAKDVREVGDVRVLGAVVEATHPDALRDQADQLKDKYQPAVILLGAPSLEGDKALLVCSVSKALVNRFHAGKLISTAAGYVGGRGGGRPDFAQAGGPNIDQLQKAVSSVYENVEKSVN